MATYRPVYIGFWQDDDVLSLTPEQKYFFLYIMTNSKTSQSGLYKFSRRVASFETGYNNDTINKLLEDFIAKDKIAFDFETDEILIMKWLKYNPINNGNVLKCVTKELKTIKSIALLKTFKSLADEYAEDKKYMLAIPQTENMDNSLEEDGTQTEPPTKPLDTPLDAPRKYQSKQKQKQNNNIEQINLLWSMYPRKKGKADAIKKLPKLIETYGYDQMVRCIQRYKDEINRKGTLEEYVQQGKTFFNSGFVDFLDENFKTGTTTPIIKGNEPDYINP